MPKQNCPRNAANAARGFNTNHACFIPCPTVAVNVLEQILGRYYADRTRQRAALLDAQEAADALCIHGSWGQFIKAQTRLDRAKTRLERTEHILAVAQGIYQQHQEAVLCSAVM